MLEEGDSLSVSLTRESGEEEQPGPSEIVIPKEYIGTFKGTDKSGTAYEVVITAESITVKIGGTSYPATINGFEDDEFNLTVNGTGYYFTSYDEGTINQIMFYSEGYTFVVYLNREGAAA